MLGLNFVFPVDILALVLDFAKAGLYLLHARVGPLSHAFLGVSTRSLGVKVVFTSSLCAVGSVWSLFCLKSHYWVTLLQSDSVSTQLSA